MTPEEKLGEAQPIAQVDTSRERALFSFISSGVDRHPCMVIQVAWSCFDVADPYVGGEKHVRARRVCALKRSFTLQLPALLV